MSTDVHLLSGAYALHALSPEETEEFRRHLEACEACREEVRTFRSTAARLGAGEAAAPPERLRARVLAAADEQRQLPPRGSGPATASGDGRRTTGWLPRVLAAAAAVVVLAVGVVGIRQLGQDPTGGTLAAEVTRVFEADDASTVTMRTGNGGEITVATSRSLGRMAVDTDELPDPGSEQVYQLWVIQGGTPDSAGVLADPDEGAAMKLPEEGVAVAITVEPEGGSTSPTTEPIMQVVPSEV